HIEELGAKLEPDSFTDPEILEHRKVPYLISGALHGVASHVPKRSQGWVCESTGVEECARNTWRGVDVSYLVWPLLPVGIGEAGVAVNDGEPIAFGEAGDSTNLPAANERIEQAASVAQCRFTVSDRQLVEI